MPFWKKSEDPWDREPERKRDQAETPQAQPSGETQDWSAWKAPWESEDAEAQSPPPMACPWCGRDMQVGRITGGGDPVRWRPGWPPRVLGPGDGVPIRVDHEGTVLLRYKTAYLCRACRRMVLEFPAEELEAPQDTWQTPPADGEETDT